MLSTGMGRAESCLPGLVREVRPGPIRQAVLDSVRTLMQSQDIWGGFQYQLLSFTHVSNRC